MSDPIRIGIIGMGGFAGYHHDTILALEAEGACRLVCACDPNMETFSERQCALRFTERGIGLFTDYLVMLDAYRDSLDVVTIPTPIPLHAPMHQACVTRKLPVYLEKPPTLDYHELLRMLAVEATATRDTMVGFSYIGEGARLALKQRLVAGEFGAIRRISMVGMSPRPSSYYARAAWAGRLMLDERLVLDSVMGNAMAHAVNSALFWGGLHGDWQWGQINDVTAELYRANSIEGTDTIFVRAALENGPEVLLAMSHACNGTPYDQEWVECEHATITGQQESGPDGHPNKVFTVQWNDGRCERIPVAVEHRLSANIRQYFAYLRGEANRPLIRLDDTRPFVLLNNLAYVAAGRIVSVPGSACKIEQMAQHPEIHTTGIDGLTEIALTFIGTGRFPSQQGVSWAAPGGQATPSDLPRLTAVVRGMVGTSCE